MYDAHNQSRFADGNNQRIYEEFITRKRACQITQDQATRGEVTVSIETQREYARNDFDDIFRSNLPAVLKVIRSQSREDQEMLLSYHLLSKGQKALAQVYPHKTQTIVSYQLRRAGLTLGAYLLFGSPITKEAIAPVLEKAGLEDNLLEPYDYDDRLASTRPLRSIKTSVLVEAYAKCRNYQHIAETLFIRRPEIRRTLSNASKALLKREGTKDIALGTYIFNLIAYTCKTKNFKERQGHVYITDPPSLGEFSIDVNDRDFKKKFTARAKARGDVEGNKESGGNQDSGPFNGAIF